jgi:hypothetical protein
MFCDLCGTRLVNGDCYNCFDTKNALEEFENEED